MSTEQETVLMIRGAMTQMPKADQLKINEVLDKMQALRSEYGHVADMALALLGAELAAANAD